MTLKRRAAACLFITCLLLLGLIVLVLFYPAKAAVGTSGEIEEAVTDIPVSEFGYVTITNRESTYGVINNGGELELVTEDKKAVEYDIGELRSLVYGLCHISGGRKNTDSSTFEALGLSSPLALLTLVTATGESVELRLLSENPMDKSYYLYIQSENAVYSIGEEPALLFLRPENGFYTRTVLPVITLENYGELKELSVKFSSVGRSYKIENLGGEFYITEPIRQRVLSSRLLQELLNYTSALYSDEMVAKGGGSAISGQEKYTVKIDMSFAGKRYSAFIFDEGDGGCLVTNANTGDVHRVKDAELGAITADYLSLLGGFAYQYPLGDVRDINVSLGSEELFIGISGSGQEGSLRAVINGAERSDEETKELMEAICQLKYEAEAPAERENSGERDFAVTFALKNGRLEQVDFFKAPGGDYYVSINSVINFLAAAEAVESIRAESLKYSG